VYHLEGAIRRVKMNDDASARALLDSYAIEGGEEGKRRLDQLAEIMRPTTSRLLEEVGVGQGQTCLDLGCGGGHVTLDLAEIVGRTGSVIGIDIDQSILELARRDAAAAGIKNVLFQAINARFVEGGPFDVIYARFLLSHVERPEEILEHLAGRLTDGGVMVVEDIDFSGCFCYPDDHAYDRFVELYVAAVEAGGGDANLGRRLPALVCGTALHDVKWNVFQPVHREWPDKRIQAVTMEKIGPALLRHGLATTDEIDEVLEGMQAFAADPETLVAMPRIVQVWGRA
jgi:ubiquinone/menaquinone biosynthesis C-methylase UbiE